MESIVFTIQDQVRVIEAKIMHKSVPFVFIGYVANPFIGYLSNGCCFHILVSP